MWFVGIDWSHQQLDYELRDAAGRVLSSGDVRSTTEGLAELFSKLDRHAPPEQISIAFEAVNLAWVQALSDRGYTLYPLNPKMVKAFRETLSAAGDKSDAIDRSVLARLLATMHTQFKPWRPDAPEIVALRIACQDRLRLIEERTAKVNELQAILKAFYPAVLGLFGKLSSRVALQFLRQFPTQQQMHSLTPKRLASWLRRQHYTAIGRLEEMQAVLGRASFEVPAHLQQAKAPRIGYLAASLLALDDEIKRHERIIEQAFDALPEARLYRSLPGAGPALAPALAACFGRDPQRFASVDSARAFLGTAPVTWQSGRWRVVAFRRACWKFGRRTLHVFAGTSLADCAWAKALYRQQRALGHRHHESLRAVAHTWVKIILAMRKTGEPYDESRFLDSRRHNPVTSTPADPEIAVLARGSLT